MPDQSRANRREFMRLVSIGAAASLAGCMSTAKAASPHPAAKDVNQDYQSTTDVMVEMRDGVSLATDIYRPRGNGSHPTLVFRTPYNKQESQPHIGITNAIDRGFAVVVQDVRGRFASEGDADWEPVFEEGPDGYDTIEWAADQSWSTGKVGMLGRSYMGMTTWRAALEDPPSLQAIHPTVPSWYNYKQMAYQPGGLMELGNSLGWLASNSISTINRLDVSEAKKEELQANLNALLENPTERAYKQLPLTDIPEINAVTPSWERYIDHHTKDQYWNRTAVPPQIDQLSVPVLHVGGWYDTFKGGMNDVYNAIEADADEDVTKNHHMIMGPWTHLTIGTDQTSIGDHDFGEGSSWQSAIAPLVLDWFDHWLTNRTCPSIKSLPKVRYFQMGTNEWRDGEDWPPSPSRTDFYLDSTGSAHDRTDDGILTTDMPLSDRPQDTYTFDPFNPVPTRGGTSIPLNADAPGISDQSEIESRSDVLVYSTDELNNDVSIAGPIDLTLFASSTAPDTDFVAKLVDVHPDGYAANIAEGGLRTRFRNSLSDPELMEPETVYELPIRIWHTAHTFEEGHRIRLDITSSNFPRYDRNPNTGTVPAKAPREEFTTADQTIYHDGQHPSRVTLPVITIGDELPTP